MTMVMDTSLFLQRRRPLLLFVVSCSLIAFDILQIVDGAIGRYYFDESKFDLILYRRKQIFSIADDCSTKNNGTSLGESFLSCVFTKLEEQKDIRLKIDDGDSDDEQYEKYGSFPIPSYKLNPLTIQKEVEKDNHGVMLLDLLRNYTCGRVEDGGSPVIETKTWTYDEKRIAEEVQEKTCPANFDELYADPTENKYKEVHGYLPQGDDVGKSRDLSIEDAKKQCDETEACEGFTFQNQPTGGDKVDKYRIFFKSKAKFDMVNKNNDWRSYVTKSIPSRCLNDGNEDTVTENKKNKYKEPIDYEVQIIRNEPLVTIIPNFVTKDECDMLIKEGGTDEEMGRAYEGGGPSQYRRSYSTNIYIDYENQTSNLTKLSEKMFAYVREFGQYDVHGPGQEPLNAVLYKDIGDEYRPHCDGPCNGGNYPIGQRVATTILYCETPSDDGHLAGQTSFTRSGLMISPKKYDFLLFTYKYQNGTVDNGYTEHSGCPILGGRKWIATQWYREGVHYDNPWNHVPRNY